MYVFEESQWGGNIYVLFPKQLTAECRMVYRKITAEDVVISSYPVTRNSCQIPGLRNVTTAYQLRRKPSFSLIRLDPQTKKQTELELQLTSRYKSKKKQEGVIL